MVFRNGGAHVNVSSLKLLDFLDWVTESVGWTAGRKPPKFGVLLLPPVQRSAVWRPKQVLDLWDSILRGLPIGIFYLVEQDDKFRIIADWGSVLISGTRGGACGDCCRAPLRERNLMT
ncbi:MAG: DUF262 domain-containing protein [Rhodospirillales bacterium]|nr:DUF262 domain-containing protein [Rhodospirillales bacterium]